MVSRVKLTDVPVPVTEIPTEYPELPREVYEARLERLRKRMESEGLDAVIVYADREHAANFAYLAGFGPRFEEALLIVPPSGIPTAVLGNENIDMVRYTQAELKGVHYASFSLIGQPREDVPQITEVLKQAGVSKGMTVGLVGWKYFEKLDGCRPDSIEVPHYLVEAVQEVTGTEARNATAIFMSPADGLRTVLEVEAIVAFEYAACLVAKSVLDVMDNVAVGKTEMEIASAFQNMGVPLSVHPMLSVGEKARFGLTSPTGRKAALGDFFTTAYGIEGALCCRSAFIAAGPDDLPAEIQDWLEKVAVPFYATAAQWYETIGIGVRGGDIWDLAETNLPREKYGWQLNPGHFIAADEWVSTPFTPGSDVELKSGNYMQFDLIIAPEAPYYGADLEDGLVLADEDLRARMQREYPQAWARFERRRRYVQETLGINLREEVLPMSDILGYYRPFLLSPGQVLVVR